MKRDLHIDTLRGLVCLLLVVYHAVGSNPLNGLRIDEGAWRLVNDALVCLRMPMFALLAGYSLGLSRSLSLAPLPFVQLKARHLLLPGLTVGTLFALLQAITPNTHGEPRNWWLLHIEPVAHFWYIESLFWVLLILHTVVRAGALSQPRRLALLWLAAAGLSLIWRGPRWLGIEGAVYLLPYALMGLALTQQALRQWLAQRASAALLLALALGCAALLWPPQPDPNRRDPALLLLSSCLCLLLMRWQPQQAALAWLGRHAFSVFLFHAFFTAATRIVLGGLGVFPQPVLLGLIVVAGITGPLLLERLLREQSWASLMLLGQQGPKQPVLRNAGVRS